LKYAIMAILASTAVYLGWKHIIDEPILLHYQGTGHYMSYREKESWKEDFIISISRTFGKVDGKYIYKASKDKTLESDGYLFDSDNSYTFSSSNQSCKTCNQRSYYLTLNKYSLSFELTEKSSIGMEWELEINGTGTCKQTSKQL
jgi:hypothetical protein